MERRVSTQLSLEAPDDLPLLCGVLEAHLNALYAVSRVLSRSLDFKQTLREVLEVLQQLGGLSHGMFCLVDGDTGDLLVSALYGEDAGPFESDRKSVV